MLKTRLEELREEILKQAKIVDMYEQYKLLVQNKAWNLVIISGFLGEFLLNNVNKLHSDATVLDNIKSVSIFNNYLQDLRINAETAQLIINQCSEEIDLIQQGELNVI